MSRGSSDGMQPGSPVQDPGAPPCPPAPRRPSGVRRVVLIVGLVVSPLLLVALLGAGLLVLLASGRVQFVSPPDRSTANRPAAYGPATEDSHGVLHGTHFTVRVPDGWQTAPPPVANPNMEAVLKRP